MCSRPAHAASTLAYTQGHLLYPWFAPDAQCWWWAREMRRRSRWAPQFGGVPLAGGEGCKECCWALRLLLRLLPILPFADQTTSVQACQDAGITVHNFSEFLGGASGEEVTAVPPKPDDLCCIMYTRWGRVFELGVLELGWGAIQCPCT